MQVRPRSLGWAGMRPRAWEPTHLPGMRSWQYLGWAIAHLSAVYLVAEARPGMPGLYPKSVSPCGRPILLCVLRSRGSQNSQGVLGLEEGDSSRLDAFGAFLLQKAPRSSTGLVRHQAHQRSLDYCHRNNWRDARTGFYHGTKMFFDIAIIGSTWLRLDRQERRRGWVVRLFCSRQCGVACPAS